MEQKNKKVFWQMTISVSAFYLYCFGLFFVLYPTYKLLDLMVIAAGGFIALSALGFITGGLLFLIFRRIELFVNTFIICGIIIGFLMYYGMAS